MLVRLLNFVMRARVESQIQGSFMIARIATSLGRLVERNLSLKNEHLAAVGLHLDMLKTLADDSGTCAHAGLPPGPLFEIHFERVEQLVRNLEALTDSLITSDLVSMPCHAGETVKVAHRQNHAPAGR